MRSRLLQLLTGRRALIVTLSVGAALATTPAASADVRLSPLSAGHSTGSPAASAAAAQQPTAAHAAAGQPFSPGQIRSAYSLPSKGAARQTIAVVSVFDDPYIQSDLNAYSRMFGLPRCTGANHCFHKLNQGGRTKPLPPKDPSGGQWITESSLGVELARGVCPTCKIMLVEANTTYKGDVAAAIEAASQAGATVVVTSITPTEDAFDGQLYERPFSLLRRTAVVAATGDAQLSPFGYGNNINFPSSLPAVIAVGGTHLNRGKHGSYGSEQVWQSSVSGCSLYNKAPAWQAKDAAGAGCGSKRAVADLAAMADPGAIVHITGSGMPGGPLFVATGTSVAAPIIAGVIGLAGSDGSKEAQLLYQRAKSHPSWFHHVSSGSNGPECKKPICKGNRSGYNGPTGLGTPNGLAAFLAPQSHTRRS